MKYLQGEDSSAMPQSVRCMVTLKRDDCSEIVWNLCHRNLTKIISSCCFNLNFKALILEYIPKKSLNKLLYSRGLTIMQKLNIMFDVEFALEFLHHGYSVLVIHVVL
uniref:Protein kinase domain-containing protein n=1 Tax=Solanum lycopersicum TaxID=4081 RepID=A0A3Q7GUL5_SOLLC